ncbi:MAG: hypothetical protein MUP99_06920, partial [Pedobacter sp.]|nr:hypothetical protein [Pedobacter sp.]
MNNLYSFLANAKAQHQALTTLDGIVMYHLTESVIPEYIYFMPKNLVDHRSLSKFFDCQFIYMPDKFYVIYFNPIRWVMPDLADVMNKVKGIAIQYGKDKLLFQMTYGRLIFDRTHTDKVEDK